ncbi:MAG: hypothetical protein ACFFB3_14175 [Candidatus Hodarchaeota archaeon]
MDQPHMTVDVTCEHCKKEHKEVLVPPRIISYILKDKAPPEPLTIQCGADHSIKVFLARGVLANDRALIRHSYVEFSKETSQRAISREDLPSDKGDKVRSLANEFFSDLLEAQEASKTIRRVKGDSQNSTVLALIETTPVSAEKEAQHLLKQFESENPQEFKFLTDQKSATVEEVRLLIRFFYHHLAQLTARKDLSRRNQQRVAIFHAAIVLQDLLGQETADQLLKDALKSLN